MSFKYKFYKGITLYYKLLAKVDELEARNSYFSAEYFDFIL